MSPPRALSLITIPPELLLAIISHLPSSTSLYALSVSSRTLSSFMHTHASTISNTRIHQNPTFNQAASILQSSYVDGWLVPKHPCVVEAEEQWQHELSSRSASRASSPQYRGLNLPSCCFRTGSFGSGSSNERAPRPRFRQSPRQSYSHTQETPLSPTQQPLLSFPPITRHTDLSLSLSLGLPLPFKLSRPGPHYLVFLERYAAEIVARWQMDIGRSRALTQSTTSDAIDTSVGTQLDTIEEEEDEAEKMEMQLHFMLKLYCLRNWLVLCHNTFINGDGNGIPYAHIQHQLESVPTPLKTERFLESAKEKVQTLAKASKDTLRKAFQAVKPQKKPQRTKRLLFGEIDTDSASSLASAVWSEHGSHRGSSLTTAVDRDCWVKGILWFYGVSSQLSAVAVESFSAQAAGGYTDEKYRDGKDRGKWYCALKDEHFTLQANISRKQDLSTLGEEVKKAWRKVSFRPGRRRFKRLVEKDEV